MTSAWSYTLGDAPSMQVVGILLGIPEESARPRVKLASAGGEITKAARNWLGNKLDASKRSQLVFMDRDDILNLFVVTNLPLPAGALPKTGPSNDDDPPF